MPRFSNGHFPGFCQFSMEKNEFTGEMKTLYDFPYFLRHIKLTEVISNYNKTSATWHLHV